MSHSPYLLYVILTFFVCLFVSLDEKSPQRETFCQCGRDETKKQRNKETNMAEELKGIKIDKLKNCFEQWRKTSQVYYIKRRAL